ncbi:MULTISPECIES: MFS transporter [unclassified Rathayibacter]|uniref:MFS transporter n=1 Tax=unclassified Rathayibacter TaxID=2609250 RepID=UPI000CE7694B|nr:MULTISPECIES: MFS transporter [unclassified Rathayibacter]PPH39109.1 MFS transporter [Rathayibacter sp. AY1E3]PPH84094.1 MFS transporter [Rathayibacter sp. AY1D5]PPI05307.1 MFS transporter [Rathayibacter sp. AY1B8]
MSTAARTRPMRAAAPFSQRRLTIALLAAGVATFAELYAVQSVLPQLAREWALAPSDAALTVSAATLGLALSVLPWASVAERIGRLESMRIAVLTSVVLALLACVAPTFELLLVLRFLGGAALGAVPALAVAAIHDRVGGAGATAAATAYVSGTTIGGAAGRLLAGPLAAALGWRGALLVVTAVCAAAAIVFAVLAPRGGGTRETAPGGWRAKTAQVLRDPMLVAIALQTFLAVGVFVAVYNYLAFRLEAPPFALAPALVSLLFAAYLAGTLSSRLAGRWGPRIGPRLVMRIGVALMIVGLLVMLAENVAVVIAGLLVFTAGFFALHATGAAWTGARAVPALRGHAGAVYTIAFYAGSAAGGWLLGLAVGAGGWPALTAVTIGLLLVGAGIVSLPSRTTAAGR